jgi:replicative DNA helicase
MIDADSVNPMPGTDEALFDGDPIPLTQTVPIPAFPVGALPGPIAEMVHAVAEATQTDPAMPATSALSALSACTGGHAEIEIRGGWREPCNLYTATIAAPGERKSAVQLAMVRPLLDAEQHLADAGLAAQLEAETRKQVASKAAEKMKQAAAAAANTDNWDAAMADALGAAQIADSIGVPAIPRLIADDVTPEAAASLLAEQAGGWRSSPPKVESSTSSPAATTATSPTWTCGSRATPGTR